MNELETLLPILRQAGIMNSEDAINFADQYLGGSLRNILLRFSGILDDNIRLWQFKNQVKIALKAKEYCKSKGIDNPRKLENTVVIPLIEDAKNVEDENLSEMFAGLLGCQLDPETYFEIHPSFSKTLIQLSPLDAKILSEFYSEIITKNLEYRKVTVNTDISTKQFNISKDEVILSYQNLWRLGICDHGDMLHHLNRVNQIIFTDYGMSFMNACMKIKLLT